MSESLSTWKALLEPDRAPLLESLASGDPTDVGLIARLRKRWSAEDVRAAAELTRARAKARSKFSDGNDWVADVAGVEQATDERLAHYKAEWFRAAGIPAIVDLCSGVGGDLRALGRVAPTVGFELDPVRAWMAEVNSERPCRACDVVTLDPRDFDPGTAFHFDPARRQEAKKGGAARRLRALADYQPGIDVVDRWREVHPDGAIKLGPGIEREQVPVDGQATLEFVEVDGELRQAIAWYGALASAEARRATLLVGDDVHQLAGVACAPKSLADDASLGERLYLPPAALERAELVGLVANDHDLREIAPGLGLLTGSSSFAPTPWLCAFDVHDIIAWRVRTIERALEAVDAGPVTFRTRGGVTLDPKLARRFSKRAARAFTVFAFRRGRSEVAVITTEA